MFLHNGSPAQQTQKMAGLVDFLPDYAAGGKGTNGGFA